MRLALVADVHGNLAALEAVVADFRRRGADQVLCLGDNLSGPLLPHETAQFLMASGWVVLAGDHERQILTCSSGEGGESDRYALSQLTEPQLAWLGTLKPQMALSGEIFLCHGTPRSDCEHLLESVCAGSLRAATRREVEERLDSLGSDLVACGHSHVPRSIRLATGQLVINPGSVGLQAYVDELPQPFALELGSPDARYAIVEKSSSGWIVEHHAVAYDACAMATLARLRRRFDWEQALLRGHVR